MIYEREYNTATTISFPIVAFSTGSFYNSVTTTMFAAGDATISKDYGAFANTATTPTHASGVSVVLSLTATEMSARHIEIHLVDQTASKVWEDQAIIIETYGTTTAQHTFDRSNATVQASLTANQSGVTIATVTQVTNQVQASLTANQTGVTIATVTQVTNQVQASLTANQTGVTVAAVTSVAGLAAGAITNVYTAALSAASLALTNVGATTTAFARLDKNVSSASTFDPSLTTVKASLTANQSGVTIDTVNNLGASAASQIYQQDLSATSIALTAVGITTTAMARLDKNVSSMSTFDPSLTTVKASLTANQAGVTIATVSDVTRVGSVTGQVTVTGTVAASLTAAQTGVTIENVTTVINGVTLNTAGVGMIWDETATAHTAATSMGGKLNAAGAAADPWTTTLPGAYPSNSAGWIIGQRMDTVVSSIIGTSSTDWTDAERAQIRHALGVSGSATSGSGGVIHSISSVVTTMSNLIPATVSTFDPSLTTVQASLTAAQTGVTIAAVSDVTRVASCASVAVVTGTVQASLTASQTGVTVSNVTTVATTTNVTNTVKASLTAAQTGVTVDAISNLGASAASQVYAQALSAASAALTGVGATTTAFARLDKNVSSASTFDPSVTTVKASLTASQTGVTIATVTDITNAVKASLTAAQVGVTIANVTTVATVSGTVQASLTASQAGVTVATVTGITNPVTITSNADITAIKAKTDNLPEGVTKNAALNNFEFLMVDSTDHITIKTGLGAGVTAERSIDGGAFAACANAVSEVSAGIYKINLDATDLNGDVITFKFSAAGADMRFITIKTEA